MSFNKRENEHGTFSRRFRKAPPMTAIAIARIEEEGAQIMRSIASREPAKVFAEKVGLTPRHTYNLRDGECQPRWMHFIAMAQQYPELRAAVGRWLGFPDKESPVAEAALDQIRRIVQQMPEEGDAG